MSGSSDFSTVSVLPDVLRGRWFNADRFDPDDKWSGFDPKSTAIVLVDLINWQFHPDGAKVRIQRQGGAPETVDYFLERCENVVLPSLRAVLDAARSAGVTVVHARLASRSMDYDDIVPAMRPYVRAAEAVEGSWGSQVLAGFEDPRDISVLKSGSGAYNSSDLDGVLRNVGIRTVLYAGGVTSGCVLLTVAAGYDLGYRQYLLTDCTAAATEHDQQEGERFMNNFMAQAVTAAEAIAAFENATVPVDHERTA